MRPCQPPRKFTPAGRVARARLALDPPSFAAKRPRLKGSAAAGVRYERKALAQLAHDYAEAFVPQPWLQYQRQGNCDWQWCQPDGLIVELRRGLVTIVECKLRHTPDAWWQLRKLYEPVVQALFGAAHWRFSCVEVCRWFDPHTPFPEAIVNAAYPTVVPPNRFGVHIWAD